MLVLSCYRKLATLLTFGNKTFRPQTISPVVVSPMVFSPLKLSLVVSPLDPGRFAPHYKKY